MGGIVKGIGGRSQKRGERSTSNPKDVKGKRELENQVMLIFVNSFGRSEKRFWLGPLSDYGR